MVDKEKFFVLVEKQRKYFNKGETLSFEFRIRALKKLKELILEYQDRIEATSSDDLGKSPFEVYVGETAGVLSEINEHIKHLKKWMKPKKVRTPLYLKPSTSKIMYEPYGVSLIISPWNYPFQLAIMPLIAAISAGNTAIIKPSEMSPATGMLIEEMISENFDPAYIAVVNGGVEESNILLKQNFDFIFFTGSSSVAKIVAKRAAEDLTPYILELGGKSPVILDETVPIKLAIKRILFAKLFNSGQTCIAPDYILIKNSLKDAFISSFEEVLTEFFLGMDLGDVNTYTNMARILDKEKLERMKTLLEGEEIIWGGKFFEKESKMQITLIDSGDVGDYLRNKKEKTPVLLEELFGLILPLLTFENIEETVEYINIDEKPLALYLFSNDRKTRDKILNEISFGGGCINDVMLHISNINLPFGGVGNSGHGKYHGKESFLAFSNSKGILTSSTKVDLSQKYLPYTEKKLKFFKKFLN